MRKLLKYLDLFYLIIHILTWVGFILAQREDDIEHILVFGVILILTELYQQDIARRKNQAPTAIYINDRRDKQK